MVEESKSESSAELKRKLTVLRGEKVKAQDTKDKKKIDILRRQISHLKKQTRKTPKPKA